MQKQYKKLAQSIDQDQPFQIIRNARKKPKRLQSTASKSRKNSVISLPDQKQKKLRQNQRKLTQDLIYGEYKVVEQEFFGNKFQGIQLKQADILFQHFGQQKLSIQQKIKQEKEQNQQQKQVEDFYFKDNEGQKGIFQGFGDENMLSEQCNFDFFNPENYRK